MKFPTTLRCGLLLACIATFAVAQDERDEAGDLFNDTGESHNEPSDFFEKFDDDATPHPAIAGKATDFADPGDDHFHGGQHDSFGDKPEHLNLGWSTQPRQELSAELKQLFVKRNELSSAIQTEKSSERRAELAQELKTVMGKMFDEDHQRREQELTKLEVRVGKLRATQDARFEARDRIIDVHIEKLLLDAEGLSLPSLGNFPDTPTPNTNRNRNRNQRQDQNQTSLNVFGFSATEPVRPSFRILAEKPAPNGNLLVDVAYTTSEQRQATRVVPYKTTTTEQRTRMVRDGQQFREETYDVQVPKTETREEAYTISLPKTEVMTLEVPSGANVHDYVNRKLRAIKKVRRR